MPLTNQQIENVIEKIQAGESQESLIETYGDTSEVNDLYEVYRFLQAQSLAIKPSKKGLELALNQAIFWDDDEVEASGWHQWAKSWRWAMGGSLSLALLLLVFTPWVSPDEAVLVPGEIAFETAGLTTRQASPAMAVMMADAESESAGDESMENLINQLEADFDNELVEYQNLKKDYMPLAEEEVFSAALSKALLIL